MLVLAFALTTWLTSPERVTELGGRLAELLPADIGAVALGLWLFLLHVVVIVGWLATQSLDELVTHRSTAR